MQKNIYIEHDNIYINTPYGIVYIECTEISKEFIVSIHEIHKNASLSLSVSDRDDCICEQCDADKVNRINEDAKI